MAKEKKKGSCLKTILIVVVVLLVLGAVFGRDVEEDTKEGFEDGYSQENNNSETESENKELQDNEETEAEGVTNVEVVKEDPYGTIDEFTYKISGSEVFLESFDAKNKIIEIKPSYDIDGTTYTTNLSDFQVGIGNDSVETVILDEGITNINDSAFNSCAVKKVFFPKSMQIVYDKTLSYLNPDEGELIQIYYAGTQDEWANIFKEYVRTKVGDAESAEEIGTSLGDKVNEMFTDGYNGSEYEYFFSASPDTLKQ